VERVPVTLSDEEEAGQFKLELSKRIKKHLPELVRIMFYETSESHLCSLMKQVFVYRELFGESLFTIIQRRKNIPFPKEEAMNIVMLLV
jgi:hypothetical protein